MSRTSVAVTTGGRDDLDLARGAVASSPAATVKVNDFSTDSLRPWNRFLASGRSDSVTTSPSA